MKAVRNELTIMGRIYLVLDECGDHKICADFVGDESTSSCIEALRCRLP